MTKLAAFIAALLFSTVALAQGYPNRAVKVIVPWPPGQATDIAARVVAEKLPGARRQRSSSTTVPRRRLDRHRLAVKSAPDGYTLLAASSGPCRSCRTCRRRRTTPTGTLPDQPSRAVPFVLVAHPSSRRRTRRSSSRTCARTRTSTPSRPPAPAHRRT